MPTSQAEGSQTATINTEHTLSTVTDSGTFVLYVDTVNMANGDELELRVKYKVRATGTTREMQVAYYAHSQGQPVKPSIPVISTNECVFTLKQTAGTGRAFPWEIIKA